MQKLKFFQSLWAMDHQALPDPDYDGSREQAFAQIAQAGYKGVCIDPFAPDIEKFLKYKQFYEDHDLECMVNIFPKSNAELRDLLNFCREMDAVFVNVIGQVYPLTSKGAIPIIYKWLEIAEDVGVPVVFETHRECITNDMFFTLELIDNIPEMRLCADLSHYVLNREVRLPLTREWEQFFDRLIQRSDCLQGRVASREQIQVQLDFPQHQEWVTLFKEFWRRNIVDWRARAGSDSELIFVCELGPPPYAMTDANGKELSDRWQEASQMREWVTKIWDEVVSQS